MGEVNKSKIIAIVGKSCTGKSELERRLANRGYHKATSYTTRPMRIGEVDGEDYYFISKEKFFEMEQNGELLEKTSYEVSGSTWYYGLGVGSFKDDVTNILVVNPSGLFQLLDNEKITDRIYVVFLHSELKDRINRYLLREKVDKSNLEKYVVLIDRVLQDEKDFESVEKELSFVVGKRIYYGYNLGMNFDGMDWLENRVSKWIEKDREGIGSRREEYA